MTQPIEALLDDVHQRVLKGDYATLPDVLPLLEAEFSELSADDPASLKRVREKAARNAACLDSALAGFRAARRRLAEIMTADKGLATYDSQGTKHLIENAKHSGHRA